MVMESANTGAVSRIRANTSGQRRPARNDIRADMETSSQARGVELDILSCRICADHRATVWGRQGPLSSFAVMRGKSRWRTYSPANSPEEAVWKPRFTYSDDGHRSQTEDPPGPTMAIRLEEPSHHGRQV
jgi:hypothetical protein